MVDLMWILIQANKVLLFSDIHKAIEILNDDWLFDIKKFFCFLVVMMMLLCFQSAF